MVITATYRPSTTMAVAGTPIRPSNGVRMSATNEFISAAKAMPTLQRLPVIQASRL